MAKKKNTDDPKKPNGPRSADEPDEQDKNREQPREDPEKNEHDVHREILERRMRGGPAPTPEEYTRALEEWKKLPGSVVRPPTDIKRKPDAESSEESDREGTTPNDDEESSEESGQGNSTSQTDHDQQNKEDSK